MQDIEELFAYFDYTLQNFQKINYLLSDLTSNFITSGREFQEIVDKHFTRIQQQDFKIKLIDLFIGKLHPYYSYYENITLSDLEIDDIRVLTKVIINLLKIDFNN